MHWSRVYQAVIRDWQALIIGLCTHWSRGYHALITWLRMHWWRGCSGTDHVFIRQWSVTDRRWSWDCARTDHVAIMHWWRDCACTDDVGDQALITWLIMHWSRVYQAMISDWQALLMGLCTHWSRGYHALITWLRMHWWRGCSGTDHVFIRLWSVTDRLWSWDCARTDQVAAFYASDHVYGLCCSVWQDCALHGN